MSSSNSPVIAIERLGKTYELGKTQVKALIDVTFDVQKNEFMAIMGPSGSGKSTLMNLLGCLDTPTEGSYVLNGKVVSQMTENDLAFTRNREIGFVFQVFNLLPRATAFRNVELPLIYKGMKKKEREEKVRRAIAIVGMSDRMDHHPPELSGGERQRIAIARALVNEPSLLLADEPTGNLDSKTGQEILNLFHKLHEAGNTIIMVTHDSNVAQQTERILFLKDGRLEREVKKGA
jgi:putative ABC transport system ATP-binding protein